MLSIHCDTRVLMVARTGDTREYYRALGDNEADLSLAQVYGRGLSQLYGNDAEAAVQTFERLRQRYPETMAFHTALGQAQLATGRTQDALETLERARELAKLLAMDGRTTDANYFGMHYLSRSGDDEVVDHWPHAPKPPRS